MKRFSRNAGLTMIAVGLAGAGGVMLMRPPRTGDPIAQPLPTDAVRAERAWFENVAQSSGLAFRHIAGHRKTYYMPEIMAGGVGLIDYDRDGYLDVYFVQSGYIAWSAGREPGNQLFRNRGDGTFEDVTASAGVADTGYGMGCTCGDFNNDGWTDIYITNTGPNVLYRNNGDGTFTDVTVSAGVGDPGFGASAAFVDYDRDGHLDLFVVNYIRWSAETELDCTNPAGQIDYCEPLAYGAPAPDTLYRNRGDGTFEDVTEAAGLSDRFGNGLGVVCADLTGDGWPEIVVANDLLANQLWINQGNGTFRDYALVKGMAFNGEGAAESGMGIDAQDINGDGRLDVYMTHFTNQTNTVYINRGRYFVDASAPYGLAVSLPYTGFGTALIDLNNDGFDDTFVANGRVVIGQDDYAAHGLYAEPNLLMEGLPEGGFREVTPRGGTDELLVDSSRGAAFGDYDNDGDVDIIVVNNDGPTYVLRNLTRREASKQNRDRLPLSRGVQDKEASDQNRDRLPFTRSVKGEGAASSHHWITFHVLNRHGSEAIGTRVEIEVNGRRRIRDVRAAYGYCTSNDPRVHFGLGSASRVDRVRVTWPDGSVQDLGPLEADRIVEVRRAN